MNPAVCTQPNARYGSALVPHRFTWWEHLTVQPFLAARQPLQWAREEQCARCVLRNLVSNFPSTASKSSKMKFCVPSPPLPSSLVTGGVLLSHAATSLPLLLKTGFLPGVWTHFTWFPLPFPGLSLIDTFNNLPTKMTISAPVCKHQMLPSFISFSRAFYLTLSPPATQYCLFPICYL